MQQHGAALGFRIPTAQERARAIGQSVYLNDLLRVGGGAFTERDLFDWTGNHFDPDALAIRIIGPPRSSFDCLPVPSYLPPPSLLAGYYSLRDRVASEGHQVREHPVPSDLVNAFYYATDEAAAAASAHSGQPPTAPTLDQTARTANPCSHPDLEAGGASVAAP